MINHLQTGINHQQTRIVKILQNGLIKINLNLIAMMFALKLKVNTIKAHYWIIVKKMKLTLLM